MTQGNDDRAATPATPAEAGEHPSGEPETTQRPIVLSVIGLLFGVIALGLAAIPAIAFERPLPNPFAGADDDRPPIDRPEPPPEREGGVTLKYKKFSLNVGGKVPKKEEIREQEEQEAAPKAQITKDPIRWFTIAAIGCALLGFAVATIGQLREQHSVLTASSMGCCAAALTWQYFAVGIALGAAAAAFLIVLAILAAALNGA